jgi:hypothetical protein
MATLSDAADTAKIGFRWIVIFGVVILGLVILLILGQTIKNNIFPPKPLPPTVAFGKIPKLDLSEGIKPPTGITYSLETISGELPKLPVSVKVFVVAGEESSFGALERTKIMVTKVGFTAEPQNLGGNIFKFIDPKKTDRNITVNVASGNFQLVSNYTADTQVISTRPRTIEDAMERAFDFFNNFELKTREFPKEKVETRLLRIDGNNLTQTPALASANLVEINFKRADLDKLPIIPPRESSSSAQALVSQNSIVSAQLAKLAVEPHKFATYPLKGTAKAFEDLKAGKGYLNKEPEDHSQIPIRDVSLAYLENKKSQGFLQPVYVFKSDKGLVAYVSAVDEAWTK